MTMRRPMKHWLSSGRRVGYLGTCGTPYCGGIEGYFCVKCRKFVAECHCGFSSEHCDCNNKRYWASHGERPMARQRLAQDTPPAHLDTEREGAADAAMSRDRDE